MTVINLARNILTDDAERQKYDAALDKLEIKDGENPGLVEVRGDNAGIEEIHINLPLDAANQQKVEATTTPQQKAEATTAEQIKTIECAYKDVNCEMAPKNFEQLEEFVKRDHQLEPKSYGIFYTKKGK